MIGILVHGDNHFIVQGPQPDHATAARLAKYWSLIQIGRTTPADLLPWTIVTRAFRENLEWAIVVRADSSHSPAVSVLLQELAARGIPIQHARSSD